MVVAWIRLRKIKKGRKQTVNLHHKNSKLFLFKSPSNNKDNKSNVNNNGNKCRNNNINTNSN